MNYFDLKQIEYAEQIKQISEQALSDSLKSGRYTLEQAARYIAQNTGDDEPSVLEDLKSAVKSGALKTYAPGLNAPCRSKVIREFLEEVFYDDLNEWLKITYPRADCLFPEVGPAKAVKQNDKNGKKYDQQKESFNNWLDKSQVNIDALIVADLLKQVKAGVEQKDKRLWNIEVSTFRRNFWQRYSKEQGIKKNAGRRARK